MIYLSNSKKEKLGNKAAQMKLLGIILIASGIFYMIMRLLKYE